MRYKNSNHMCRVFCLVALFIAISSCGSNSPPSRILQMSAQSADAEGSYLDSEDVVTMMMVADKLPNQEMTASEREERKSSLMPLHDGADTADAITIEQDGFRLDSDADAREVTDLRVHDTPVKNQGSRPWCTSFATIAAVENLAHRFFGSTLDLSEIHHFKSYGVYQTSPSLITDCP